MKRLLNFLLFIACAATLSGNTTPTISLSKVTPEGGVTYNSIMCIAEDEIGRIWLGSNDGLFCYNSIVFKRYSHFQNDTNSISTNRINAIYKDLSGQLWISTENGLCLYNYKTDNFKTFSLKDQFGNPGGKIINSFFQDRDGTYWFADERGVGTVNIKSERTFYKNINGKTENVSKLTLDDQGTIWVFYGDGEIYYRPQESTEFYFFTKALPYAIHSVFIDNEKLWIAYETDGLLCLNLNGAVQAYFKEGNKDQTTLPSNQVRSVLKDENGQIWAATYNGIAVINDYKVVSVINPRNYSEMPNHSVWSLFKDSQKNIWIGTYLGGLCFHSQYNNSFNHYAQSVPGNSLSYNVVSSFAQVPDKEELIVGTEDGNLNYFSPLTNEFKTIPVIYNGIKVKNIKSLTYDKYGTLWVGTFGHGVLYQKKNSNRFIQLTPPFASGFQALDILSTDNGLWVSNYPNGAYFYDFETKEFKSFRHNPLDIKSISGNNVRQIIEDKNGDFWFATRNGLNLLKKESDEFIHFFHQEKNPSSLSSNIIYSIHEDDNGLLWIGTNGEGLDRFNPETGEAEHFTIKDGLPGNEIFSILQDKNKTLWITTNQGLCMFDAASKRIRSFNNANGISNNRFNPNSAIFCRNGDMYFGGTNGFIRFRSEDITSNPIPPSTIITHLYVNNHVVLPLAGNGILNDVIGKTKALRLKYTQNSIGFRFATNNYIDPTKNSFKYRMLGFNDEWITIRHGEPATFTKIPAGKYTFEVKAANNDGIWNEVPTQISVRIVPPFWLSWYAYLIYLLLIASILFYLRQQFIKEQQLKNQIELEKVKRENEDYIHQMKLQLFTNISHEFRTPLTLIQGPVNRLMKDEEQDTSRHKHLILIKNNTDRLLRLINQFLDFRKADSGMLKLNPVNSDIISFCRNIYNCFEDHANFRSFDYQFKTDISKLKMDFDPDKLDKVMFNLLSNAFKYSSDGGHISLEISSNVKRIASESDNSYSFGNEIMENFVEISVSDTGRGIHAKDIASVFERFYQIDTDSQKSSGIGLSLSKNYILLHNGRLVVNSKVNKGTTFTVYIPQKQSSSVDENSANVYNKSSAEDLVYKEVSANKIEDNSHVKAANQEALILVVEDNSELLNYLGDLLGDHFRVAKARNGKIAMEQINSLFPDLVISDIMMPEMDGIELCEAIKTDIRTSHIPVVLLTALDSVRDRIKGLQSGADIYLPKPFDDDLLIVQINNLLESRKVLRESFNSIDANWEDKYTSFDLDKKLLIKAVSVVEDNLTDFDLSVEILASKLNLSRTHLHRKLKSLTNQSATEFIRDVRLKNAVRIMKEGKLKVNEVGYAVGFNSHNYFTRSFKKQYGISPSEFMRDKTRHLE